jgi:hypothetical protein
MPGSENFQGRSFGGFVQGIYVASREAEDFGHPFIQKGFKG